MCIIKEKTVTGVPEKLQNNFVTGINNKKLSYFLSISCDSNLKIKKTGLF